jgi:uncharacterized membrane protein
MKSTGPKTMSANPIEFRTGVITPVECLKEGWAMIKSQYWLFFGICIVGMLVSSAFAIVLMGPMMCGIFFSYLKHMRGERVTFDGLFKGFDYFGQSLIATLIQAIPAVIIIALVYLIMFVAMIVSASSTRGRDVEEAMMFVTFIGMALIFVAVILLSIVLGVFFMFTFPLIVDRNLSGVEAIKTSMRAGRANLGGVVGLMLLTVLLNFGGLLVCCVGGYFLLPITFAAQAVAYRRVFPDLGSSSFSTPPPPPGSWAA